MCITSLFHACGSNPTSPSPTIYLSKKEVKLTSKGEKVKCTKLFLSRRETLDIWTIIKWWYHGFLHLRKHFSTKISYLFPPLSFWTSCNMTMISSLIGISSPCKCKVESEVMGSMSFGCMCNLPMNKGITLVFLSQKDGNLSSLQLLGFSCACHNLSSWPMSLTCMLSPKLPLYQTVIRNFQRSPSISGYMSLKQCWVKACRVKFGLITFSFSIELTSVHGIPHHACNISKYGKTWPILVFCTEKRITHLKPIRTLATLSSIEPLANCYWLYMPNTLFCQSSC